MSSLRAPRGTTDILPEDQPYWRLVREAAADLAQAFGYRQIDTPLFEDAGVFARTVGGGTDIVDKEMYVFEDRGGDRLALKPEGTAGVCRAYIEHGMASLPQPVRLFYISPFFRYDRPQAGRYRQFHQLGLEAIGESDPILDAEIIHFAWLFYERLGLRDLTVQLNSIGDPSSRTRYIEALRKYYAPKVDGLCRDCKERLQRNPLRLLDCKQPQCQPLIAEAPSILDYLDQESEEHFAALRSHLDAVKIPYVLEPRLVRGLDYYTRTVFEVVPAVEGAQSTIGGGGRYDGLIELLGGRHTPGVGFATGLERIILNLKRAGVEPAPHTPPTAFVAWLGEAAAVYAMALASELRAADVPVVVAAGGRSLKAQMRQADSLGARHVLICGGEEIASDEVTLRDMATSEQSRVRRADVSSLLSARSSSAG
jgi:histidyl-tRNA synthetase